MEMLGFDFTNGTRRYKTAKGTVLIETRVPIGGYIAKSEITGEELYYDICGNCLNNPEWDLIEAILPKPY